MPLVLLPDAELTVIRFVRDHPDLLALTACVTPDLTGTTPVGSVAHPVSPTKRHIGTAVSTAHLPFIQVNRVGGNPTQRWEDNPRVQISVWHRTDTEASDLARSIAAAMPDIVSDKVRAWDIVLGPLSQPDENNKRYVLDVELLTYA